jgi:hypothetical protein
MSVGEIETLGLSFMQHLLNSIVCQTQLIKEEKNTPKEFELNSGEKWLPKPVVEDRILLVQRGSAHDKHTLLGVGKALGIENA